ncbi:MAG TPA: DUF6754 domain-containing protein [Chloroflexia bacterium]|nr:DUF6754 domain-containing protein [Chloroflexia bacterium]
MNISLALGPSTVFVLIALLAFLIFFFAAWAPIERGRRPLLRPLRPFGRLQRIIGQSAETGQTVHYSPGNAALNGQPGSPETLNGLTTLSSVARGASRTRANLLVSADDSLAYTTAADITRAEYGQAGRSEDYNPSQVRFITQQDRLAYITGVSSLLKEQPMAGNVMIGQFGSEYLLAGDRANRSGIPQVVGSSRYEAMPLMIASAGADNTLLGEEIFAAPAYLDRQPAHLASVVAQDRIRVIVILLIIAGVIAATLGVNIGDYFLR